MIDFKCKLCGAEMTAESTHTCVATTKPPFGFINGDKKTPSKPTRDQLIRCNALELAISSAGEIVQNVTSNFIVTLAKQYEDYIKHGK